MPTLDTLLRITGALKIDLADVIRRAGRVVAKHNRKGLSHRAACIS